MLQLIGLVVLGISIVLLFVVESTVAVVGCLIVALISFVICLLKSDSFVDFIFDFISDFFDD